VFDVRVLPNPHYVRELRPLTGATRTSRYLEAQPEVGDMLSQIETFIARWLPAFVRDQRSYLTVAIGCTAGSTDRSTSPKARTALPGRSATLIRHRELTGSAEDARGDSRCRATSNCRCSRCRACCFRTGCSS
jgi:UPF0042 nucleotide-binding protein